MLRAPRMPGRLSKKLRGQHQLLDSIFKTIIMSWEQELSELLKETLKATQDITLDMRLIGKELILTGLPKTLDTVSGWTSHQVMILWIMSLNCTWQDYNSTRDLSSLPELMPHSHIKEISLSGTMLEIHIMSLTLIILFQVTERMSCSTMLRKVRNLGMSMPVFTGWWAWYCLDGFKEFCLSNDLRESNLLLLRVSSDE